MRGLILSTALGAAALAGCYATGDVGYSATYSATAAPAPDGYAATPDLVTVQPGVQVVADYDEPVFFTDGFYWRFYDGYWYRSNNYYAGWYFYERPPVAVLRIDRPYAYAHYRPSGYVARRTVRNRPPETIARDHRGSVYAPSARPPAYAPNAAVRDHRTAPAPAAAPASRAAPAPRPAPAQQQPAARDHRTAPAKDVRDHRHE
jgi:hypothetical protein